MASNAGNVVDNTSEVSSIDHADAQAVVEPTLPAAAPPVSHRLRVEAAAQRR